MSEVSLDLARFIADVDPGAAVREHVADLAAGAAAAALAGAGTDAVRRATATVDRVEGGVACPLVADDRMTVMDAALLTGTAAGVTGSEDAAHRVVAAVTAAALAHVELVPATADALLDALAVGIEIGLRMGAAVGQPYLDRGWDVTGVAGSVGAAAAVARLAATPTDVTTQALGVAATQGAGLRAAHGTDTWALHVGKAAANGVEATLLCAAGFSGPPAGIEGRRGFLPVAAPEGDVGRLTAGLGTEWTLLATAADAQVAGAADLAAVLRSDGDVVARIREVSRPGAGAA
jgi:2-methylcitrate dehydratase PrpD